MRAQLRDESRQAAVVRALPFQGDDDAWVAALRAGNKSAIAVLCERYGDHLLRVLCRVLGRDADLEDLHHDVFMRAITSFATIKDPGSFKGWVTIIAVNVARTRMKQRSLRRWLSFLPFYEVPEPPAKAPSDEDARALRATYAVLEKLPAEERIVFCLRIVDGLRA